MAMLSSDIREVLETILPEDALAALLEEAKFQQRERKCEGALGPHVDLVGQQRAR